METHFHTETREQINTGFMAWFHTDLEKMDLNYKHCLVCVQESESFLLPVLIRWPWSFSRKRVREVWVRFYMMLRRSSCSQVFTLYWCWVSFSVTEAEDLLLTCTQTPVFGVAQLRSEPSPSELQLLYYSPAAPPDPSRHTLHVRVQADVGPAEQAAGTRAELIYSCNRSMANTFTLLEW